MDLKRILLEHAKFTKDLGFDVLIDTTIPTVSIFNNNGENVLLQNKCAQKFINESNEFFIKSDVNMNLINLAVAQQYIKPN
jgi:hypothetical protein